MADPVRLSNQQKAALAAAERTQSQQLIADYRQVWQRIRSDLDSLQQQIRQARAAGEAVNRSWLYQQQRLAQLLADVDQAITVALTSVGARLTQQQADAVVAAHRDAQALVQAQLPPGMQFQAAFPFDAFNQLVGYASDGQPLGQLLAQLGPEIGKQIRDALLTGVALGQNPTVTAKAIRTALGGSLARAVTIARSETLRAYREASRAVYVANPQVVTEWVWLAKLDGRTCPVCWFMSGEVFQTKEEMETHPNAVLAGSSFVPYGQLYNMVAARYSGPAVRIFAGPETLTIGPNHPILTRRGMVPAKLIHEGDELVYDLRLDHAQTWDEPDLKDVTSVEDAFQTLRACSVNARITTAGGDLHGDRVFCEDKIHVVEPDRELLQVLDSCGIEQFREAGFVLPDVELAHVSGQRASGLYLDAIGLPTTRSMSGGGSLGAHHLFLPVSQVDFVKFDGWAFDASTETSLYCSDGFVVSNCRCALVPRTKTWEELGFPGLKETRVEIPRGSDVFAKQPESVQRQVLGPAKFAAFQAGDITLADLVEKTFSRRWGGGRREASLTTALGG